MLHLLYALNLYIDHNTGLLDINGQCTMLAFFMALSVPLNMLLVPFMVTMLAANELHYFKFNIYM